MYFSIMLLFVILFLLYGFLSYKGCSLLYNKRYNLYYNLEYKYTYDLTNYDLINKYIEYIKVLLYLDEKYSIEIDIGGNLVRVDNNLNCVEKFLGLSVKRKRYEQVEVDNEWYLLILLKQV